MLVVFLALAGCSGVADDTGVDCVGVEPVTAYAVDWATDPAPALAAVDSTFTLKVRDQRGCAIEDLQRAHERIVHTLIVSTDLTSFQHLHQEDSLDLTAEDLRSSTFHFPLTLPAAGDYRLVFDYAHQNQYLTTLDWMTAGGTPAQADTPALDYSTERTVGDLVVTLRWDIEPASGYEASWTALVRTADGTDVTDLVQWLGADGHAAVASADLGWVSHTHAWFPDMETVAPGHDMPHLYLGPDLPFHYTFPNAGPHKMWLQFARADAPDTPYVADFAFDVAP
ncbi:MAG: hypothetical protein Q8P41_05555 [Pseudomonadota bacterium]|nr:hypothetical protein [Pseudomonadota bacterium]